MANESLEINKPLALPSQYKAVLLVTLSGILYGFLGFFGTEVIRQDISIPTMLFWRFLVAGIWMLLWECWRQKTYLVKLPSYPNFILPCFLGASCYSIATIFYFLSSQHVGTGLAMVIYFSYPMFIAIVALIKNNWRMNRYTILSLALIAAGLILLKGKGEYSVSIIGIFFGMLSAFFYGMFVIGSKRLAHNMTSSHATILVCFGCAAMLFLIANLMHSFTLPTSLKAWGYICAISIIATAIPIQLMQEGLKALSSLKASIISVLEPVITLLVGMAFLSEAASTSQMLGVLVILSGAIVTQFARD